MEQVLLCGGSGVIGSFLEKKLQDAGYSIIHITRRKSDHEDGRVYLYDSVALKEAMSSAKVVVNLAGAPLFPARWTTKYKDMIYSSRIETTKLLVDAMSHCSHPPETYINASAIGYYGIHPMHSPFKEDDHSGNDFLSRVCVNWEKEAQRASESGIRVVCIRTGIVLSSSGGALPMITLPFRFFIGGPIGLATYPVSWISIEDEVGIILHCIDHANISGAVNACAPDVVTNKEFARHIGDTLHRPSCVPVPSFFLHLLFGEAASIIANGSPVSSQKIQDTGYIFSYPTLKSCLEKQCKPL